MADVNFWSYPLDVPAVVAVFGRHAILGVSGWAAPRTPPETHAHPDVTRYSGSCSPRHHSRPHPGFAHRTVR